MCYSMFEKRSGAAKKDIDTRLTARTGKEAKSEADRATTAGHSAGQKSYASFKRQIQHWMGRDEQKEKEAAL